VAKDDGISLSEGWQKVLSDQFALPYFQALRSFLARERSAGKEIYPPDHQVFAAFNHAVLNDVKVVIIGQDPYHGPAQAHGFSFSVQAGISVPPSLRNIFKELHSDMGMPSPSHGDLSSWADQGVLLLNSVLTVEQSNAGSHQGKGWETFTDSVIKVLNEQGSNLVFVLWGGYAQKKGKLIDSHKHCVLQAPHPSPLSSYRGFFGCGHFSKTNAYLREHGRPEINWASVLDAH
jgi:uracil-DNA glycosylase